MKGQVKGAIMFAAMRKDDDKGEKRNCLYTNNFWITDPIAANIPQESCFNHTHDILLISMSNKKKIEEG